MSSSLVLNRTRKVPAEDSAAFGAIAERFRRGGALDRAVSLCRDGLAKFPDHISARVTLGWSLLDLGKYDEARVELEQVLRRAPDNLAAIRGLAELHDRFEHTLNLPMDGPGQWPPPAESIAELDAPSPFIPGPDAAETFEAGGFTVAIEETGDVGRAAIATATVDTQPVMAPAEMGMPLWSPAPEAVAATPVAPAAHLSSGRDAESGASGMSSVREIDAATSGITISIAEPSRKPESTAAPVADGRQDQVELGVTDVDIAALIAEADTLDAVAETSDDPDLMLTVDAASGLDEDLDLSLLTGLVQDVQSVRDVQDVKEAPIELSAAPPMTTDAAEAPGESASEQIDAIVLSEPVAMAEPIEAAVQTEADAEVVEAEGDRFELTSPVETDAIAEFVETESHESPVAVQLEVLPFDAEPEVAAVPEAAAVDEVPEVGDAVAAPMVAAAAVVESVAAPDVEPAEVLVFAVAAEQHASRARAQTVALERFLARVHARRRQLMTESVA